MKSKYIFILTFLIATIAFGQEEEDEALKIPDSVPQTIDSLYREDQFYVGFTFNLVTNKPSNVSQESFSGGLHLGFIRDFPVNEARNVAIGAGLGWSINSYGQSLFIGKSEDGKGIFQSLDEDLDYDTNRFTTQLIEAPIQFRWRSSTPETYKFWRIYTGFRLGYIYHFKSNYVDTDSRIRVTDIPELDRFRLGATFTFGYNTFNFQFYYSLNPFFKDAMVDNEKVGLSTLKIGLMFYIL